MCIKSQRNLDKEIDDILCTREILKTKTRRWLAKMYWNQF